MPPFSQRAIPFPSEQSVVVHSKPDHTTFPNSIAFTGKIKQEAEHGIWMNSAGKEVFIPWTNIAWVEILHTEGAQ